MISVKCQVHTVLAGAGVPVGVTDLFGAGGQEWLHRVALTSACRARIEPGRRVINCLSVEVDVFTTLAGDRLRGHPRHA